MNKEYLHINNISRLKGNLKVIKSMICKIRLLNEMNYDWTKDMILKVK